MVRTRIFLFHRKPEVSREALVDVKQFSLQAKVAQALWLNKLFCSEKPLSILKVPTTISIIDTGNATIHTICLKLFWRHEIYFIPLYHGNRHIARGNWTTHRSAIKNLFIAQKLYVFLTGTNVLSLHSRFKTFFTTSSMKRKKETS